jgi:hypothetical protein
LKQKRRRVKPRGTTLLRYGRAEAHSAEYKHIPVSISGTPVRTYTSPIELGRGRSTANSAYPHLMPRTGRHFSESAGMPTYLLLRVLPYLDVIFVILNMFNSISGKVKSVKQKKYQKVALKLSKYFQNPQGNCPRWKKFCLSPAATE